MNTTLFTLPESDREKMQIPSFINEYHQKVRKGEDEMLIKVLTTYLGYTPTIEDYKRCQMIYRSGVDNEYTFCYDNFPLGYIKRSFEDLRYNVTFTPINK
jgi:hypothetical protein